MVEFVLVLMFVVGASLGFVFFIVALVLVLGLFNSLCLSFGRSLLVSCTSLSCRVFCYCFYLCTGFGIGLGLGLVILGYLALYCSSGNRFTVETDACFYQVASKDEVLSGAQTSRQECI